MIPRRLAAAALLAIVVLSGCARPGPSDAARFNDQSGNDAVACLVHQRYQPDPAYEGGPRANTLLVLTMLPRYLRALTRQDGHFLQASPVPQGNKIADYITRIP